MCAIIETEKLIITTPRISDMQEFLELVAKSAQHFNSWVTPPSNQESFTAYIEQNESQNNKQFLIKLKANKNIVGIININEIVYKSMKSGYLGFYSFLPSSRQGHMSEALLHILNYAFYNLDLHRLEANIQPSNQASINFITKSNFTQEGLSSKYLKIAGKWRDHLRFAITKEQVENLYLKRANQSATPWHADFDMSLAKIQELCENVSKQTFQSFEKIAEGWDNWVFLANKEIIFRLPRRYIGIALFAREAKVLNLIKDKTNIQIPNLQFSGFGDSTYPYPIQGYKKLPGNAATERHIPLQDREHAIVKLAKFLKKLHNIPLQDLYAADIEETVFNRCDFTKVSVNYKKRLEHLSKYLASTNIETNKFKTISNRAAKYAKDLKHKCLIHGDLYARHLLFHNGELTSIIDWGDTGINNPAVDIAALYSFFPASCHALFFEHYGETNQAIKSYASFLGLYSTLFCLDYALDIQDPLLEKEALLSLKMQTEN